VKSIAKDTLAQIRQLADLAQPQPKIEIFRGEGVGVVPVHTGERLSPHHRSRVADACHSRKVPFLDFLVVRSVLEHRQKSAFVVDRLDVATNTDNIRIVSKKLNLPQKTIWQ